MFGVQLTLACNVIRPYFLGVFYVPVYELVMESPNSCGFRFLQFCLLLTAFAGFTLPLFCMMVNLTDRTDGYLFLQATWIALAQDTGGSVAYSFVRLFFAAGGR